MTKDDIKKVRVELKMSRADFGAMLGVTKRSVEHWEQGDRNMSKTAQILLKKILKDTSIRAS